MGTRRENFTVRIASRVGSHLAPLKDGRLVCFGSAL